MPTPTKQQYSWSTDEEHYHGPFDTPEAAAWAGLKDDDGNELVYVGVNRAPDMTCPVDGDDVLDQLQQTEDFLVEQSDNFAPTAEQEDDLTVMLQKTWGAWLERHGLVPGFWIVEKSAAWVVGEDGQPKPVSA